jgi:hypothetical protein
LYATPFLRSFMLPEFQMHHRFLTVYGSLSSVTEPYEIQSLRI